MPSWIRVLLNSGWICPKSVRKWRNTVWKSASDRIFKYRWNAGLWSIFFCPLWVILHQLMFLLLSDRHVGKKADKMSNQYLELCLHYPFQVCFHITKKLPEKKQNFWPWVIGRKESLTSRLFSHWAQLILLTVTCTVVRETLISFLALGHVVPARLSSCPCCALFSPGF